MTPASDDPARAPVGDPKHTTYNPPDAEGTRFGAVPASDAEGTRLGALPANSDAEVTRFGPEPAEPPASKGSSTSSSASGISRPRVRRVGDYELLAELGRGAMGVVYKARDMKLGRLVAVKMIRSAAHASTGEVDGFLAEARAEARLDHPHIVPVFEIGESDGLPYFAMALVEG